VGVIGYLPPTPVVIEDTISTGPYKLWGSPRDTALREIEMIKQGFYRAVVLGRGPRLKIGPDVLLRGQIWPAAEALRLGLVDRLGTESDAYDQAAAMAHLWHYQIVDLDAAVALTQAAQYSAGFFRQSKDGVKLPYPVASGIYMLYVPTSADRQK
jgi:ClpP class serine protease